MQTAAHDSYLTAHIEIKRHFYQWITQHGGPKQAFNISTFQPKHKQDCTRQNIYQKSACKQKLRLIHSLSKDVTMLLTN